MVTKPPSAEIYTTSHRILGRINTGAMGLFSFLNIPTTSSVEIDGATLSRLHQPGRLAGRYQSLWLVKNQIVAVLLSSRVELGPSTVLRGGYTTSVQHNVHIALGGYELTGVLETSGKFNFGSVIFEGDRIFVPLYQAVLIAILFPNVRAEAPAVLFNRETVDTIGLMPREETSPLTPPATPPTAG